MCLLIRAIFICCFGHQYSSQGHWTLNYYRCIHSDAASVPTRNQLVASVRWPPMRVNISIRSSPHGRDALPRDPAWHVHKREQVPYPLYTRERPGEKPKTSFETCHAGSRGSASLPH
jgi:hypothetical protein